MANVIHHNLVEITKGMLLNENIAKGIWDGKRSLVVSQLSVNIKTGTLYYLIDEVHCYGVIRFKSPQKINVKEFQDLYAQHLITDDERKHWWPDKEILFAYHFDVITKFDALKPIEMAHTLQNTHTLIYPFNFCRVEKRLIANISDYDADKYDVSKLYQDLDIALSWLAYKHTGKVNVLHSLEDIHGLIKKLYTRIKLLDNDYHLDVSRLHPVSRNFILKLSVISGGGGSGSGGSPGITRNTGNSDITEDITGNAGKKVNYKESFESLELNTEKILTDFRCLSEALSQYWQRHKLNQVIDDDDKGGYTFNDKILCVEKYNDFVVNALLIKYCGVIQLRDAKNFNDLTAKYPGICAEAYDLCDNVFILACELDDKPAAYITDILYLATKNVDSLNFHDKQSLIHSLNLTNHIKEKMRIMVKSQLEFDTAKQLIFGLPFSDGLIIRQNHADILLKKG